MTTKQIAMGTVGYNCSIPDPRQTYLIINLRRRTLQSVYVIFLDFEGLLLFSPCDVV